MKTISILIYIFAMFVAAISQILLKKSANKTYLSKLKEYLNWYVITAYVLFTLSMAISLFAYRYIPMSYAPVLESSGIIFIIVLGRFFLGEVVKPQKYIGVAIMILGIALIAI